jgi:hypothetical protein
MKGFLKDLAVENKVEKKDQAMAGVETISILKGDRKPLIWEKDRVVRDNDRLV